MSLLPEANNAPHRLQWLSLQVHGSFREPLLPTYPYCGRYILLLGYSFVHSYLPRGMLTALTTWWLSRALSGPRRRTTNYGLGSTFQR